MAREPTPTQTGGALMKLLESSGVRDQIAKALPKHMRPETVIRMAMTVFRRTPSLHKCEPETIVGCVVQASELGLELSGPLGQAWMVPRWNRHTGKTEATFQVGYRGYFDLAFRSGKVAACPMRTVFAADTFALEYGTEQKIVHRPSLNGRGQPLGFYTVVMLRGGDRDFEFMSVEDIDAHVNQYVQKDSRTGKIPDSSPWNTAREAMSWKTTARRVLKRVPVSVEIQRAVTVDECEEQGLLLHRPELQLSRAELVGAKIGAEPETDPAAASEPERGQEGGAAKPATKKQLGVVRGHLARLGIAEEDAAREEGPLEDLTAEAADELITRLANRKPADPPGVGDPANDPAE